MIYRWFGAAAESESLDGLAMLGYMKQNALAVNKDIDGAVDLYIKALAKSLNIKSKVVIVTFKPTVGRLPQRTRPKFPTRGTHNPHAVSTMSVRKMTH